MSKSFTGDSVLAEMTEGQTADPAFANAPLNDETTSDSSSKLQKNPSSVVSNTETDSNNLEAVHEASREHSPDPDAGPKKPHSNHSVKQRFGLPRGFEPRWQRYGRSILLAENIYRLPDDREFVPSIPRGTLGARQHSYALLTIEQYLGGKRGSVYIRSDGRIFDYSVDSAFPGADLFDTGYTIHDLERTGRYAPSLEKKKKKVGLARRAASAGKGL